VSNQAEIRPGIMRTREKSEEVLFDIQVVYFGA